MAATRVKLAGYSTLYLARETTIFLLSLIHIFIGREYGFGRRQRIGEYPQHTDTEPPESHVEPNAARDMERVGKGVADGTRDLVNGVGDVVRDAGNGLRDAGQAVKNAADRDM